MERKYQIFVSSTYKDLEKERQIAIKAIMKLRHIPAAMEFFTATGEDQLEMIRPMIDESDYYLIILGGKYGTLAAGEQIAYTEKEYDYAVSKGKRIIAFVHSDPENLDSSLRETNTKMINKFRKFRSKVLSNGTCALWEDAAGLATEIASSISNVTEQYPAETFWIHTSGAGNLWSKGRMEGFPVLEETDLTIDYLSEDCFVYSTNVPHDSLLRNRIEPRKEALQLSVKLDVLGKTENMDKFVGYCTKNLPRDWRSMLMEGYKLNIQYTSGKKVPMWLEIKTSSIELFKKCYELEEKGVIEIDLEKYKRDVEDWINVREMCFVFRPSANMKVESDIEIQAIDLEKPH